MEIDIHLGGRWHPCATVTLTDPARKSRQAGVSVEYETDYALEHLGQRDYRALTVHAPVNLGRLQLPHWPSFLVDLLPQGAARARLERQAGGALAEWTLLERGARNPVGNLRVRPHEEPEPRQHPGFELQEMIERGDAFIDHALEVGAVVAGATDTQGEAPKFWVVQDENGRWHPDSGRMAFAPQRFALLKFPVPEAGPRAQDILRHEAAYQRIAACLGLRVTPELPEYINGALLIPRFDRRWQNDTETRLGVESLYSVAGVIDSVDTPLRHHEALIALARCLSDFDAELLEYVRRDLLNIALGNRDNHGRNTAILKETDGTMRLTPLYDFGPAFLDARVIVRTMRWDGEEPGVLDWNRILDLLELRFEEAGIALPPRRHITNAMRSFADELKRLPELMRECAVDQEIIEQRRPEIARLVQTLEKVR